MFDCYKVLIVSDKQVACVAGAFSGYPGYPHAKFQIIEELRRVKGGGGGEISPLLPLSLVLKFTPTVTLPSSTMIRSKMKTTVMRLS